jgi:hypothetical protein
MIWLEIVHAGKQQNTALRELCKANATAAEDRTICWDA